MLTIILWGFADTGITGHEYKQKDPHPPIHHIICLEKRLKKVFYYSIPTAPL